MSTKTDKPKVYLVEDDADDQYMFKMLLKELHIDIQLEIFNNGLAAYEALITDLDQQEQSGINKLPGLILLDLNLPVWDGKKTLKRIKNHDELKVVPVVIYTTSKSEYDRQECYVQGANSFITKAAEFELLQSQIERIFSYWFEISSERKISY